MGIYINRTSLGILPHRDKAKKLAIGAFAEFLDGPPVSFDAVPENKALICVVHNGPFDAAAWIYNEIEFNDFTDNRHSIPKTWMVAPKDLIELYTGN